MAKKPLIIWPEYFEKGRSRKEGRRVPKARAIDNPTAERIFKVTRKLGYEGYIEPDRHHPKTWWEKRGRVRIFASKVKKTEVIARIAEMLKEVKE